MCELPNTESVNLEEFAFDFMENNPPADCWDDDGERVLENQQVLEKMEDVIPSNAISLGVFECVVENFTSWHTNDHYYVIPWEGEGFDWALFRILWDDNYGVWEWDTCARITNVSDGHKAAKAMLTALFESFGYILEEEENKGYLEFINQV